MMALLLAALRAAVAAGLMVLFRAPPVTIRRHGSAVESRSAPDKFNA
jgi:hypothetical protein